MGKRLSKIVTRTGDEGMTGLGDGTRVPKDDLRVEAYGTLDELNATLGSLLACFDLPTPIRQNLKRIQNELFDVGGELCIPGHTALTSDTVKALESELEALNKELPPLEEFILPGGSPAAAQCHFARTVCRRAERIIVSLHIETPLNPHTLAYVNRLSDYLFIAARIICRFEGGEEVLWERR